MKSWSAPLSVLVLLILGSEVAIQTGLLNSALFPPPTEVGETLWAQRAEFLEAFLESAMGSFAGYLLAGVVGIAVAFVLSMSSHLRRAILPYAIFFQTVPIVAIAPLMVIYFGFGLTTVIASSLFVAVFPVLAGALIGLQSMDPNELELFQIYGATRWQQLKWLQLPKAYPAIYTGLKTSAGLAVIGAVAGEFVAGGGLGGLIDSGRTQQRLDIVYGALLLLSLLGLLMVGLLRCLNAFVNRIRPLGLNLKD